MTDPRTWLHEAAVLLRELNPRLYPEAPGLAEALLAISAALRPAPTRERPRHDQEAA